MLSQELLGALVTAVIVFEFGRSEIRDPELLLKFFNFPQRLHRTDLCNGSAVRKCGSFNLLPRLLGLPPFSQTIFGQEPGTSAFRIPSKD